MTKHLEEINNLLKDSIYRKRLNDEAIELAKKYNCIIIIGGSDDLMYCYGAESYLSDYCEHSYGYDGNCLTNIEDKELEYEAKQLGLEIYWCGKIINNINDKIIKEIKNYDTSKKGAFSYKVKENINFKDFLVYENYEDDDIFCTGIIIELPNNFVSLKSKELKELKELKQINEKLKNEISL